MRLMMVLSQLLYDVIARVLPGFFFLVVAAFGCGEFGLSILSLPFRQDGSWVASFGWGLALAASSYMLGWVFSGFVGKSLEETTCEQARAKSIDSQLKADGQAKSLKAMCHLIQSSDPAVGFRLAKLEAEARMVESSRVAMTFAMGVAVLHALILAYAQVESKIVRGVPTRSRGQDWDGQVIVLTLALLAAFILRAGFQRCAKRAWENYWDSIVGSYEAVHEHKNICESDRDG